MVLIKDLISPKHRDHIPGSDILYRMRVSRRNVDHLKGLAENPVLDYFWVFDMTHPDNALAFDDQELFGLQVMVVVPAGDARLGPRNEDLAKVSGLDELG